MVQGHLSLVHDLKKKIHKGRKEKKEVWKEAISCLKKIKLNQE